MFAKVMEKYVIGGEIYIGNRLTNSTGTSVYEPSNPGYFTTSKINVVGGHQITLSCDKIFAAYKYASDGTFLDNKTADAGVDRTITLENNCSYIILVCNADPQIPVNRVRVTDITSNTLLFEYRS